MLVSSDLTVLPGGRIRGRALSSSAVLPLFYSVSSVHLPPVAIWDEVIPVVIRFEGFRIQCQSLLMVWRTCIFFLGANKCFSLPPRLPLSRGCPRFIG